jgi:hypothetical protein
MGVTKADYAAFMRYLFVTLDTFEVPEPERVKSSPLSRAWKPKSWRHLGSFTRPSWIGECERPKAGLIYFLLLFAVGWTLGALRELWAVSRFRSRARKSDTKVSASAIEPKRRELS